LFERQPLAKAVIPEPAGHDRTWVDSSHDDNGCDIGSYPQMSF
jgi:hypothetical protein